MFFQLFTFSCTCQEPLFGHDPLAQRIDDFDAKVDSAGKFLQRANDCTRDTKRSGDFLRRRIAEIE